MHIRWSWSNFLLYCLLFLLVIVLWVQIGGFLGFKSDRFTIGIIFLFVFFGFPYFQTYLGILRLKKNKVKLDANIKRQKVTLEEFIEFENRMEEELLKIKRKDIIENIRAIQGTYSSKRQRRLYYVNNPYQNKNTLKRALYILRKEKVLDSIKQIIDKPLEQKHSPYLKGLEYKATDSDVTNQLRSLGFDVDATVRGSTSSRKVLDINYRRFSHNDNEYLIFTTKRADVYNKASDVYLYFNSKLKLCLKTHYEKKHFGIDDRISTYLDLSNDYTINISSDWVNGLTEIKDIVEFATTRWADDARRKREARIEISDYE